MDDPAFGSRQGKDFSKTPRPSSNQWVMGAVSVEVNGSGCEALRSPSSIAQIKKEWRYTSTPSVCHNGEYRKKFVLLPYEIKRNFVQRLAGLNTADMHSGGQT